MKKEQKDYLKLLLFFFSLLGILLVVVFVGVTIHHYETRAETTNTPGNWNPYQCTLAEAQNLGGSGKCYNP
jgi:hypothetical protein